MGKQEKDELFGPLLIYEIKMYKYPPETVTCLEASYHNGLIIWGTLGTWLKAKVKERCSEIDLMGLTSIWNF